MEKPLFGGPKRFRDDLEAEPRKHGYTVFEALNETNRTQIGRRETDDRIRPKENGPTPTHWETRGACPGVLAGKMVRTPQDVFNVFTTRWSSEKTFSNVFP